MVPKGLNWGRGQLHILMLHQFFAINGSSPGRRFFEISRRLAEQGHKVTVITGNSELGLLLGKKKIGLLQQGGTAIVVLNLDNRRRRVSSVFARKAVRQARNLPTPDLVLASSPPLALAGSAYSLSSFYQVPLILEIRGVEDFYGESRDSILNSFFSFQMRRRALKAYCRSDSIIVPSPAIAFATTQITSPDKLINVLPDELDYRDLFQKFSKILSATGV